MRVDLKYAYHNNNKMVIISGDSLYQVFSVARISEYSHALLQGIFPIKRSNPGLPHCRGILALTDPIGKPILGEECAK